MWTEIMGSAAVLAGPMLAAVVIALADRLAAKAAPRIMARTADGADGRRAVARVHRSG